MSGIMIPQPGSELGPCEYDCEHIDCQSSRQQVSNRCSLCTDQIGYDRRFTEDTVHGWVHTSCLVDQIETERAALTEARDALLPKAQKSIESALDLMPLGDNAVAMSGVIVDGNVHTPTMTLIGPVVDFSVTCYLCGRLHGLSGWQITKALRYSTAITPGYYRPEGKYPFSKIEIGRLQVDADEVVVCTERAACVDRRRMRDLVDTSCARTASGRARHVRRQIKSTESVRSIALCGISALTEKSLVVNLDEMCKRCERINAQDRTDHAAWASLADEAGS